MAANYSFDGIADRARAALEVLRDEAQRLDELYLIHESRRRKLGIPCVAIVGMGRAGKDEAAAFLANTCGLYPVRSSSLNALPFVAHMIGIDAKQAYLERHQHREFWIEACNQLRADDLTRLARWCLGVCDMAVGLRGKDEFAAVMRTEVCRLSVWIERDVPVDPTTEFTKADCDVVVENTAGLAEFHTKLRRLGSVLYGR